jgi:hypothetical protein
MLFDERYSPLERMIRRNATSGPGVPSSSTAFSSSAGRADGPQSDGADAGNAPAPAPAPAPESPFDVHIPHQRKRGDSARDKDRDRDRATFMWGLWQCENELTFLLDESDVDKFPEGALMLSPQRWKLIKLCGREIDFDETGIVSAMSKIDQDVPSLNISTATTNCTLVPEELLDQTLNCLSQVLHCPFHDSENQ